MMRTTLGQSAAVLATTLALCGASATVADAGGYGHGRPGMRGYGAAPHGAMMRPHRPLASRARFGGYGGVRYGRATGGYGGYGSGPVGFGGGIGDAIGLGGYRLVGIGYGGSLGRTGIFAIDDVGYGGYGGYGASPQQFGRPCNCGY